MTSYLIRRLLLLIPTFFGTTLLVFWILNITPDGPYERKIEEIKAANMQKNEGGSTSSFSDTPSGEVNRDTSKKIKRSMPLWNPDISMINRYLMWLGFAKREIEWVANHNVNLPYRFTVGPSYETNEQGVPISIQKYIFPVSINGELAIYESSPGTDFDSEYFMNIEDTNFDAIGYIQKLRVWEPYLLTIDKVDYENKKLLFQKYLFMDENFNVYESILCTNTNHPDYTTLPAVSDLEKQKETFWQESEWIAVEIDKFHADLIYEDKNKLINSSLFKENWKKSDWLSTKIIDFNWFTQYLNKTKNISNDKIELSLLQFRGIFNGYLGETNDKRSVAQEIWTRIHISSFFGITGFLLSYLVCIPLGIMKALKHGSRFDVTSSGLVFIGYSIPAYAFGVLLIWFLASSASPLISWGWIDTTLLPNKGWRPSNWEDLSFGGKILGQLQHALLPTICYMLGSFATLTVLMKNSLMENMSQDYVRTAFAKGLKEKSVIFKHAVRNSLIPMATGIGGLIGIFLAGSYLIEKVFNIDGIGLLGFKSIQNRDYGIFLGFLVIGTVIRLIGNLISDICYAIIDPRIRFK